MIIAQGAMLVSQKRPSLQAKARQKVVNRAGGEVNLQAQVASRVARRASGETRITIWQRGFDKAVQALADHPAPSPASALEAETILTAVGDGKAIEAAGRPDTMPVVAWHSFQDSLAAGEEFARRHLEAWAVIQAEGAGNTRQSTGSGMLTSALVAGGIAAVVGGGYWFLRKRSA